MLITPVLLCGGSGTRLWPLSRKSYPKRFVLLTGEEILFKASAQRLAPETWDVGVDISIDYAVMEKASNHLDGALRHRPVEYWRLVLHWLESWR